MNKKVRTFFLVLGCMAYASTSYAMDKDKSARKPDPDNAYLVAFITNTKAVKILGDIIQSGDVSSYRRNAVYKHGLSYSKTKIFTQEEVKAMVHLWCTINRLTKQSNYPVRIIQYRKNPEKMQGISIEMQQAGYYHRQDSMQKIREILD